jgi:hypothetical protein
LKLPADWLNAWMTPKDSPLQNTFLEKQKAANLNRKFQWLQMVGYRLSVAVISLSPLFLG